MPGIGSRPRASSPAVFLAGRIPAETESESSRSQFADRLRASRACPGRLKAAIRSLCLVRRRPGGTPPVRSRARWNGLLSLSRAGLLGRVRLFPGGGFPARAAGGRSDAPDHSHSPLREGVVERLYFAPPRPQAQKRGLHDPGRAGLDVPHVLSGSHPPPSTYLGPPCLLV